MKKALAYNLLSRSGLRFLIEKACPWSGVLVLNYHRIGNGEGSLFDNALWSADAGMFADQLQYCKLHLDMISPADLPDVIASGRGRYGMVTFDDGYLDNYEVAFPLLKAAGVPATFFIATGFIDTPVLPWWDEIAWMVKTSRRNWVELPDWFPAPLIFDDPGRERIIRTLLRGYKTMPVESTGRYVEAIAEATGSGRCSAEVGKQLWMNWDMLRQMRAHGMTIGGHTVSHPVLARLPPERQREEVQGCAARLSAEMNEPMQVFSYPVGKPYAFDGTTRNYLREAGVRYVFTYYGGFRRFDDWEDYDIRRIAIEAPITFEWFKSIVTIPRVARQ